MCEQTEINYLDGEVVWVKLGSCWWPSQVVADDKVPPDVIQSFRKSPIAIVKFFEEDTFEYVRNNNHIYKYQCSRKDEFIKKGLDICRSKHGTMEKFPEDVIRAECHTDGDTNILQREEFQEVKKESYAGLFGDAKSPINKKGRISKTKISTPKISPFSNRKRSSEYKVTYLVQESSNSTIQTDDVKNTSANTECTSPEASSSVTPAKSSGTTTQSDPGTYTCHACPFSTSRLNVLIHHNKTHSSTFTPYKTTPIHKKNIKSTLKPSPKISKTDQVDEVKKTPKSSKPKKIKIIQNKETENKPKGSKRTAEVKLPSPSVKKIKTDDEIKNSLLADWEDEWGEEKDEDNSQVASPEVPAEVKSPAIPTSADCMAGTEVPNKEINKPPESNDVPEPSSDAKYDFCEDEDWPLEADVGRKIPRVKNISKHKTDILPLNNDEEDVASYVAKEVAELLEKTVVPVLPTVPDVLKIEENFPDASIAKSPDKANNATDNKISPKKDMVETPIKTIFKTKTFFRSRHSRSQDAIEKYVAEQLQNHTVKIDSLDCDMNGSEVTCSPEPRVSPSPSVEPVKVARLAPKIELKRMKAEAQLKERKLLNELTVRSKGVIEKPNVLQIESSIDKQSMAHQPLSTNVPETNLLKVNEIQSNIQTLAESKPIIETLNDVQTKFTLKDQPMEPQILSASVSGRKIHEIQSDNEQSDKLKAIVEPLNVKNIDFCLNDQPIDNQLISVPESKLLKLNKIQSDDEQLDRSKVIVEPSNLKHIESSLKDQPIQIQTQSIIKTGILPESKLPIVNEIQFNNDQPAESKAAIESLNIIQTIFSSPEQPINTQPITETKLDEINSNNCQPEKLQAIIEPQNIIQNESSLKVQPIDTLLNSDQSYNMQVIIDPPTDFPSKESIDTQFLSNNVPESQVIKVNEILSDSYHSDNFKTIIKSTTDLQTEVPFEEQPMEVQTLSTLVVDKEAPEVNDNISDNSQDYISDNENILIKDDAIENNYNSEKYSDLKEETVKSDCVVDTLNTELQLNIKCPVDSKLYSGIKSNYEEHIPPQQITVFEHPTDNADIAPTESERVTKVTSNDPPDVLFEEDVITTEIYTNDINQLTVTHENEYVPVKHKESNVIMHHTVEEHETSNVPAEQLEVSEIAMEEVIVHNEEDKCDEDDKCDEETNNLKEKLSNFMDSIPSESDLQIAEALINLPKQSTIQPSNFEDVSNPIQSQQFQNDLSVTPPMFINMQMEQPIFFNEQNVDPVEQEIVSSNGDDITNEIQTPVNTIPAAYSEVVLNQRFETEQEKSENLNAAQSLVQMSEQISETCEPKLPSTIICDNATKNATPNIEPTPIIRTNVIKENKEIKSVIPGNTHTNPETVHKSKLLRILEEPIKNNPMLTKTLLAPSKERNIGYDGVITTKSNRSNQKVTLIRRNVPSKMITKNLIESPTENNIVLSKMKNSQDGSNIQTYTIQGTTEKPSDANTIIIQQSFKKISNPPKLQKIKPQSNIIEANKKEKKLMNVYKNDDVLFDINSMPVVLSDDIVTAEDIERMPFVMSDGNIITNTLNKPSKTVIKEMENPPPLTYSKSDIPSRSNTPNIISKSTKGKGGNKPMLVIDKTTGKQKIIVAPPEIHLREKEEAKPSKSEKFIILPQTNPRSNRPQKIVIDPQTGKAHMLVQKSDPTMSDSKPVSAKLVASPADPGAAPGGTIMIITNSQGTQSKIVLTPEHEKILFPKKQRSDATQLQTITQQRLTNVIQKQTIQKQNIPQKQYVPKQNMQQKQAVPKHNVQQKQTVPKQNIQQSQATLISSVQQNFQTKQNKHIPKQQKSAIITSKGQLIVGGKLMATATTSKPAATETRTTVSTSKRVVISEKPTKTPGEPLIFLKQKSGAVVQLTAAQLDHLQKTGQIIQNTPTPTPVIQENKVVIQKSVTLKPGNPPVPKTKNRVTKSSKSSESPIPAKKVRQELNITSSKPPSLVPISNNPVQSLLLTENAPKTTVSAAYPELDNFEELLPSTAIVKKQELPPAVPPAAPASTLDLAASIADGQLVAVPGESFGGPQGSFYLCVEKNGTLIPIDNRPLILENNQLVPMVVELEPAPVVPPPVPPPERRDILEAALANSDVFHPAHRDAPDFRDLNANVSGLSRVSETSTTLNQPIMTPVEVPSKCDTETAVASTLEAVIGVTSHSVPTSLELPITVTDPRIARTSDPLVHAAYCPPLLSPAVDVYSEETVHAGSISMPLLSEDDGMGKSMPILTEELSERVASSVESAVDSPGREAEAEDGWSRRLHTPGSDCSETSAEIPLQPSLQISVNELHQNG